MTCRGKRIEVATTLVERKKSRLDEMILFFMNFPGRCFCPGSIISARTHSYLF
jgi:hypothetical protein